MTTLDSFTMEPCSARLFRRSPPSNQMKVFRAALLRGVLRAAIKAAGEATKEKPKGDKKKENK